MPAVIVSGGGVVHDSLSPLQLKAWQRDAYSGTGEMGDMHTKPNQLQN